MNGDFQQSSGQGIDPELQRYIKEALDNGVSREEIEKALIEAGWPQDKINEAFFILSSQQQTGFEGTQFSQQGIQQGMQQGSQGFQGSQFPAAQQSPYQSYPWVGQQQGYYPQQGTGGFLCWFLDKIFSIFYRYLDNVCNWIFVLVNFRNYFIYRGFRKISDNVADLWFDDDSFLMVILCPYGKLRQSRDIRENGLRDKSGRFKWPKNFFWEGNSKIFCKILC